jgi:hypothetical protein
MLDNNDSTSIDYFFKTGPDLGIYVNRVGNRPGQALTGLSLAYEFFFSLSLAYGLLNVIFLAWPGPAKSLAWPCSLFTSLCYIKSFI